NNDGRIDGVPQNGQQNNNECVVDRDTEHRISCQNDKHVVKQRDDGTAAGAKIVEPQGNIQQHCHSCNKCCFDGCCLHFMADSTADVIDFPHDCVGIRFQNSIGQCFSCCTVNGLNFYSYFVCTDNLLNLWTILSCYICDKLLQIFLFIFLTQIQVKRGAAGKFNVILESASACLGIE